MKGARPVVIRITTALVLLAELLLAGCVKRTSLPASRDASQQSVPVTVAPVRYTKISTPIELSGSLAAVRSVTVGAMSAGRVVRVDVRIGDVVRTGDTIAQIDTSSYAASLAQARAKAAAAAQSESATVSTIDAASASLASVRAQLEAARAHEALADITASRMATLFAHGDVSKQQRDQTQTDAAAAHAAVTQVRAGVDGARNNLDAARAQSRAASSAAIGARAGVDAANVPLRDATLTAPFDGIIISKYVQPGAVVAQGSPIVAMQNSRDLEVDVAVPDDTVGALAPGTAIDVRVDAIGGAPIPARVRTIVPSQNPALRSATVVIAIPSRRGLQPGMFARVSIAGNAHMGWVVPISALVTRAGQSGVFEVRDGIASFVPLQAGAVMASSVELIGYDGRAAHVVVGGLQRVDDGSRVTVAP